jgi:hypothetical protein
MALVKATLASAIKAAFAAQSGKKDNPDAALSDLADKLATAIDAFVKSGDVTTTVTGTCATPAGAGTITGTGKGIIN